MEFESSSGNGLDTPKATQLAKMAKRMKISNGLRDAKETLQSREGTWTPNTAAHSHNMTCGNTAQSPG